MATNDADWVEQNLRRKLEAVLGHRVSATDWEWLKDEGYIDDARLIWDPCVQTSQFERHLRDMAAGLREHWATLDIDRLIETMIPLRLPASVLTDLDLAHAIARSYVLADEAQSLDVVARFREAEFGVPESNSNESGEPAPEAHQRGGLVLDEEEAKSFLSEQLPTSEYYVYDPDEPEAGASGTEVWFSIPLNETAPLAKVVESLFISMPPVTVPNDGGIMGYLERYRRWRATPLCVAAQSLAELMPWSEEQACWFLLTNNVPFVSPLRATLEVSGVAKPGHGIHEERSTTRIEFDVTGLSVESLRRIAVHAQRHVLGLPNRRTELPSYEVFILIEELKRQLGRDVTTTEIQRAWEDYLGRVDGSGQRQPMTASAIERAYTRVDTSLRRTIVWPIVDDQFIDDEGASA